MEDEAEIDDETYACPAIENEAEIYEPLPPAQEDRAASISKSHKPGCMYVQSFSSAAQTGRNHTDSYHTGCIHSSLKERKEIEHDRLLNI